MSKISASIDNKKEDAVDTSRKKMSLKGLKDLIYLGYIERDFECGELVFTLKSITAEEQKIMILKTIKTPEEERFIIAKIMNLAFSVSKVNGTPLEDLCEDSKDQDIYDKRISVLKQMQVSVINKLFKFFEQILEESSSKVELDEIKK